eukprot:scaffold1224_cov288-Chaetoceros_neogracile.AAC.23
MHSFTIEDAWHQRVLGIALVVEEVGKFSKLAFRYPPSPPCHQNSSQGGRQSKEYDYREDNIFFSLPSKVMAKLFRTKPALCGQPMTLSIDGTIFCCRSVLLNQSHAGHTGGVDDNASLQSKHMQGSTGQTSVNHASMDQLVMFSIIVAVLPTRRSTMSVNNRNCQIDDQDPQDNEEMKEFKSQNFPVIQRIHLSLFRLCAVLQREERRCIYMSRQVAQLLEIQAIASSREVSERSSDNKQKREYNEVEMVELMITAKSPDPILVNIGSEEEVFRRTYRRYSIPLHGNLAAELADTYFALARNEVAFRPSPASLLTGRDGIIYINLHIAVNIEAASKREASAKRYLADSISDNDMLKELRPYHTILFPTVSADELLQNITTTVPSSDGDLSQRILQKLLLVCDPFKSLYDMSLETALPLSAITEAAASLIDSGACIAVPVIQSSTKFACQNGAIKLMSSLKLEFAQQFTSACPIFVVAAALTSTKEIASHSSASTTTNQVCSHASFGNVIRYCRQAFTLYHTDDLSSSEDENEESERNELPAEIQILTERLVAILRTEQANPGRDIEIGPDATFQDVESLLIYMTTWLRSHSVIVELKNYFVAIAQRETGNKNNKEQKSGPQKNWNPLSSSVANEDLDAILKECIRKNYLTGTVSSAALAWRLGITALRTESLREYGVRENKLQVVTRIPWITDDWSAPNSA